MYVVIAFNLNCRILDVSEINCIFVQLVQALKRLEFEEYIPSALKVQEEIEQVSNFRNRV